MKMKQMYHAKYRSLVGVEKNHVDFILESMIEFIIFICSVWLYNVETYHGNMIINSEISL